MAFFLTPRFAPAYAQHCNPQHGSFACRPARNSNRHAVRSAFPSFVPFLSQIDGFFSEIDQEVRREAERQRRQRKRTFRAHFNVQEQTEGYQVDGEVLGFEQDHLEIEVTDAHTLRVNGNTERATGEQQASQHQVAEQKSIEATDGTNNVEEPTRPSSPTHSDSGSTKSHQATVEDDFEDLGVELSSTALTESKTPAEIKGKEKAVESPDAAAADPEAEAPVEEQQPEDERVHWSFERSFRFPERIDASNVRASLRNGLLSITVPKEQAPRVKKVSIQ